jgi:hypothetical protein
VTPLAPERFALELTIGGATQEKLVRAQALLRHQVPSGDLAEVLDRALDALLEQGRGQEVRQGEAAAGGRRCEEMGFLEVRPRGAGGAGRRRE